jgi:fatty acid kinase
VSDLDAVRAVARASLASLERSRRRIDDLNVYPVPDGDTGTNLTLTLRAVVDALERSAAADRPSIYHEASRAALMGARGNSGVIFSQILRGAAEVLGASGDVDPPTLARALRTASDAAYRAVRRPVEGTMLTVIRELAEEAERRAGEPLGEFVAGVVAHGDEAVVRTQEQLDTLREAGVVDAGGAGLAEIVRGAAAALTGEPLPEAPAETAERSVDAVHQELSRFRYCTVFVVEGERLEREALEARLDELGDSLLVVGDAEALKVHVHTDDPGAALSLGTAIGVVEGVEIANMHVQTARREARLLHAVADPDPEALSDVVAVVAGEGNRALFASLGATQVVEGGQTMNPSTEALLTAIEAARAPEVVVLPNNPNVLLAAEQAALLAAKPVEVVASRSIPAGLAAMVAYDSSAGAAANAAAMREAVATVATGEVATASRDAQVDGLAVRKGAFIGLAEGRAVAEGAEFDEVAAAVVERLLAEPRDVLTLLTGEDERDLAALLERVRARHPEVEVDVQAGGQPHYPLLLSAE